MATYSSPTNPFIKPSGSQVNGLERSSRKDAPGIAILKTSIPSRTDSTTKDFMLSDLATSTTDTNNNDSTSAPDMNQEIDSDADVGASKIEQRSECSDEIRETCQKLVEATVQQELEELSRQNYGKQTSQTDEMISNVTPKPVNKFNFIEVDEPEDEEDADQSRDVAPMGRDERRYQHIELIKKLRLQLRDLERYAYERGELDQVPTSVLAERQNVILETLKEKLSLNLRTEDLENIDIEELKKQVDKEIHELIDPLITKEYLLSQLKTQLTDLERYVAHLHRTIGKHPDSSNCSCRLHGCSSQDRPTSSSSPFGLFKGSSLMNNDALPKTSKLIRSLVTQLICSDVKLQESAKKEKEFEGLEESKKKNPFPCTDGYVFQKASNFHDGAAWSLHIDKVILATDSLINLYTLDSEHQKSVDESLVESIVRRRLIPALKDLLSYGLINPSTKTSSTSYLALLFDPYYLLTSLTCLPSAQTASNSDRDSSFDKLHIWNVIEDFYESRSGPSFKSSSIKTLSQSFNLPQSMSGPIKITSRQALLIAVDEIIEKLANCKPNGPESHFRSFIYAALNRSKLSTWLRLIFKNKSVIKKYYHNFSFVSQPDKMDKLLETLDALSKFEFKLSADVKSAEVFVSAF